MLEVKAFESPSCTQMQLLKIKAYDGIDLLDDKLFNYKINSFDNILRKRLEHYNTNETGRAKTKVIKGMVSRIFKHATRIMVSYLLESSFVQIKGLGYMCLQTFKFNNKYRGYKKNRHNQKITNRNDMILLINDLDPDHLKVISYYTSFHGLSKKLHNKKIKEGVVYYKK